MARPSCERVLVPSPVLATGQAEQRTPAVVVAALLAVVLPAPASSLPGVTGGVTCWLIPVAAPPADLVTLLLRLTL